MICILIPVLNEAGNIQALLNRLQNSLSREQYCLVFVDDGSTDGTRELLLDVSGINPAVLLLTRQKKGNGCERGAALVHGLKHILRLQDVEMIVEMDGDLSHRPEELPEGIALVRQGHDFVIASKYMHKSAVMNRSLFRNGASYINTLLLRLFIDRKITDFSNGYRFYNKRAAKVMLSYPVVNVGPIYLGEVLSLLLSNEIKVGQFSSVYVARGQENSKVVLSDFIKGFIQLIPIVWNYRMGRYKLPVI